MANTPSNNEVTEGPGGMPVYDSEGLFVGNVRPRTEAEAPSEDLARVILHLSEDAVRRYGLQVERMDVEATWLQAPDVGEHLVLDRPLGEALREQGFDL